MRQFKVITDSQLQRVPKRKTVFVGSLLNCREKAVYRAVKYDGYSKIIDPKSGVILETVSRDGVVRRVAGDQR